MEAGKYKQFVDLAKKNFAKEIKETQEKLDNSNTPEYDFWLVSVLWEKIMNKALEDNWSEHLELILDENAAYMKMPESVHKQFINMLVTPKNMNILTDIPVGEDFMDVEEICSATGSSIEKLEAEYKAESDKAAPVLR